MELSQEISNWIKKQVKNANKKGVVFGLSGGVDSSVVAALCKIALGSEALGLILPCHSNPQDIELALKVAKKFDIKTKKVVLDDVCQKLVTAYPKATSMAKANLKPRLRMAVLYYFANSLNYLVAGTGNRSEISIGYFTKYGDGGVDILPLGGLLKTKVRILAQELEIPKDIITRPPTAGLWHDQTDESEIGITYDELDKVITAIEKNKTKAIDKKVLSRVKKMMQDSEHKRENVPIFCKSKK